MKQKVSVIVPIYNSEKYLRSCIDSILSQNYEEFELLLINDGSTDDSGDICKSFADSRIRYFEQSNKGVSAARNRGINESKGELITFVDSDDILLQGYIKILTDLQKKYCADVTMCAFKNIDESGRTIDIYESEWTKDVFLKGIAAKKELTEKSLANYGKKRPAMAPVCKLYRADIIKKNDIFFDENMPIGEDVLFNLKYAQYIDSMFFKKKVLYHRIVREGSAVMSCRPQIYKELKGLFKRYNEFKKDYNIKPKTEKKFFFDKVNDSLGLFVFRGNDMTESSKRINSLYNFLNSKNIMPIWNSIELKNLDNFKDALKFIIIKYHMVHLWIFEKYIKRKLSNL